MKKALIILAVIAVTVFIGFGIFKNIAEGKIKKEVEANLKKEKNLTFKDVQVSTSVSSTSVTINDPTLKFDLKEQYENLRKMHEVNSGIKNPIDENLQWEIFMKAKALIIDVKNDQSSSTIKIVGPIETEETVDGKIDKRKTTSSTPIEYFISPNIFNDSQKQITAGMSTEEVIKYYLNQGIEFKSKSGKLETIDAKSNEVILTSDASNTHLLLNKTTGKFNIALFIKNLKFTEYGNNFLKNHPFFKNLAISPDTVNFDDMGNVNTDIDISGLFSEPGKTLDIKMKKMDISTDFNTMKYNGSFSGTFANPKVPNIDLKLNGETTYSDKWYNSTLENASLYKDLIGEQIKMKSFIQGKSNKQSEEIVKFTNAFLSNFNKILPRFHEHGKHIFKVDFGVSSEAGGMPNVSLKDFIISDDKYSISIAQPEGSQQSLILDKKIDIKLSNYRDLIDDLTSYAHNFISVLQKASNEEIPSLSSDLNSKFKELLTNIANEPNSNNSDIIISIDGNSGQIGSKNIGEANSLFNNIFAEEIRLANELKRKKRDAMNKSMQIK